MSYYDPNYFNNPVNEVASKFNFALLWNIISVVTAIVVGLVLYFLVFNKKKENEYKGFLKVVYDLIHFKYFIIEDIFKVTYLIGALAITLLSFGYIGNIKFPIILVAGNLALRISYELMLLFIDLCHNVKELNKKKK